MVAPFHFSFFHCGKKRSEEHTSELQSRRDLVCRLLLEKKKKTIRGTPGSDGETSSSLATGRQHAAPVHADRVHAGRATAHQSPAAQRMLIFFLTRRPQPNPPLFPARPLVLP